MRYFLRLAYKGTDYHGWQIQPNAITVQEHFNKAISILTKEVINVTGCGRTDTGVHASDFVLHFDVNTPVDKETFLYKINRILPPDIAVYDLWEVEKNAHARFDAEERTYQYHIAKSKNPFIIDHSWYYPFPLDVEKMNKGAKYLLGKQDFSSFSKSKTQTFTNDCNVKEAFWEESETSLVFQITADRFLRNMVRAVVGTLINVGNGKLEPDEVKNILTKKNRSFAGVSVPAEGLFLHRIKY